MSFFGFDTSLPRDRGHPTKAPGFGATPDHFGSFPSKPAPDEDEGVDFEDTYDGLGDSLDETADAFNDDTFGGDGAPISNDNPFDFHGSTARVAEVIEQEHAVFTHNAKKQPPTKPSAAAKPSAPQSKDIPALVPDASLWGTPTAPAAERPKEPLPPLPQSTAPGGKKVMSLEEVEAQIMATYSQKQAQPQQYSQTQSQPQSRPPPHSNAPAQVSHAPFPISLAFQNQLPHNSSAPVPQVPLPPTGEPQAFPIQQIPSHMRHIIPNANTLNTQQLQQFQHERTIQQRQHNIPREPLLPQAAHQPAAAPQSRNQFGVAPPATSANLQNMSEADRMKYLEEESKRLKRNHKIAQLSRYNGLMTPQDKNFIQRIQLQQLVSINNAEDNANEDFYYTVHTAIRARANPQQPLNQLAQTYVMRNGGRGYRRQDNHLQRMEQQVARAVAAAKARPKASQLVLEGSLGKISFSNVKTPRPMLNIRKADNTAEQARATQRTAFPSADRKSLLRVIETVYDILLELEMHERDRTKLPPTPPGQPPQEPHLEWEKRRDELANRLYKETKVLEPIDPSTTHPFIAILSYSKMKKAMPRIFRHLDSEQRITILTMIVAHLDALDVVRHGIYRPDETQLLAAFREDIEVFTNNILPPLLGYMFEAPLSIVVGLLGLVLERANVRLISKTKIGLAFLTMFLSRAEIVRQSGQVDEKDLTDWQNIYNRLFDLLNGYWMECFPPSGNFVDDQYVWQFLASIAVGANMQQQQTLVAAVKDRVLENVQASKVLPAEIGVQKRENVNLFMRAMGLDVDLLG